jgi:hypothetical protein
MPDPGFLKIRQKCIFRQHSLNLSRTFADTKSREAVNNLSTDVVIFSVAYGIHGSAR